MVVRGCLLRSIVYYLQTERGSPRLDKQKRNQNIMRSVLGTCRNLFLGKFSGKFARTLIADDRGCGTVLKVVLVFASYSFNILFHADIDAKVDKLRLSE
jgi:hypothetical protein